ncbi:hypothetical protein K402DRAFT_419384 [Aulographum hederae CBS 113979]|uniref:BTB domain-containing protein n=1 Tax=Aulographum hederae CBS 113979 TaxID=1176131 RepID=A0A6G1H649_9PEZI|nr:hypothetical protein K402DRAFT_419384 [Aulographum hederae CBS 113979]
MFGTSSKTTRQKNTSFSSKHRAGKSTKQRSFRDHPSARRLEEALPRTPTKQTDASPQTSPTLTSAIVTLSIGPSQRLFAAHEDVLNHSPYFTAMLSSPFLNSPTKRIDLPTEEPEVFSSILEYLYKGDYYPRLEYDKRRNSWALEDTAPGNSPLLNKTGNGNIESTVYLENAGVSVLKDTAIYCAALRFALPELQRLALRKQGLQSGIMCGTILTSCRYAYANTPDEDGRLRAHYLALIVRSRSTFKRSGTMQAEMEQGGKWAFDLFVAMVNHMDDIASARS